MPDGWSAVFVALLLLLSGCSAPFLGDESTGEPADSPSPIGATSETAASAPPHESLSNATAVVETHRERLREAGTATRHIESLHIENESDGTERDYRERTAEIDFGTDPPRWLVTTPDAEYWQGPGRNVERSESPPEFSRYLSGPRVFTYGLATDRFQFYRFSAPERITRDGETLYRYSVLGLENADNVTVRNASGRMLLTPDGLVRSAHLRIVVDTGDVTIRDYYRLDYEKIGETNVSRPSWYDEAVSTVGPFRDEIVTVQRTETDLNAGLTMTGPAALVSPEYSFDTYMEQPLAQRVRTDVVNGARASCIVRVSPPPEVSNATLQLNYTESLVPSGEEENLSLVREDDRRNTLVPVEDAEVDTRRNVATVPVETEELYLVMHMPTFRQAFDRDSSRVASDATGVPECGG